jgi:hypothetical protein
MTKARTGVEWPLLRVVIRGRPEGANPTAFAGLQTRTPPDRVREGCGGTRFDCLTGVVIPANAGLRRQDAEANIGEADGPKGAQQERRAIPSLLLPPWVEGNGSPLSRG